MKERYFEALRRWDDRFRLVGRRNPQELYKESLLALKSLGDLPMNPETCFLDAGSGNGLISLPLLIEFPSKIVLVERDIKKSSFLRELIYSTFPELKERALLLNIGLENVSRETISPFAADGVTVLSRAFSGNRSLRECLEQADFRPNAVFVFKKLKGTPLFEKLC